MHLTSAAPSPTRFLALVLQSTEMFPPANTKSPAAVRDAVVQLLLCMYPGHATGLVERLFKEVTDMFAGRYMDYQAIDIAYHDFEHTLQATLCYARLFAGRRAAGAEPVLEPRHFELGLAATLLHDTGYLRLRSDTSGTSAKYTHVHVLRSAAFAASYVPTLGFSAFEAEVIAATISCTGPAHRFVHLQFGHLEGKLLGSMLVTADYLGQMAADDYPDELDILFREFDESDEFFHLPCGSRAFASGTDLMRQTRGFWERYVLPKLEREFDGVYRYLAEPFPDGPNPYLDAVARNLQRIDERLRLSS